MKKIVVALALAVMLAFPAAAAKFALGGSFSEDYTVINGFNAGAYCDLGMGHRLHASVGFCLEEGCPCLASASIAYWYDAVKIGHRLDSTLLCDVGVRCKCLVTIGDTDQIILIGASIAVREDYGPFFAYVEAYEPFSICLDSWQYDDWLFFPYPSAEVGFGVYL